MNTLERILRELIGLFVDEPERRAIVLVHPIDAALPKILAEGSDRAQKLPLLDSKRAN